MNEGIRLSEIKEKFADSQLLISQSGSDTVVTGINAVESCKPGDLVFVGSKDFLQLAQQRQPAALVVSEQLAEEAAQSKE